MNGTCPGAAQLKLRPIGAFDLELLAAMHAACFAEAWSSSSFASLLAAPGAVGLLADFGGEPAGFVVARGSVDEADLLTIGVLPVLRRTGIGGVLLESLVAALAERGIRRLVLEVAEDNEAARALYAAHGFVAAGRRPAYYRMPDGSTVAALLLAREGRIA